MPLEENLTALVREVFADTRASVADVKRLSGGASRETWSFACVHGDETRVPLVLQLKKKPVSAFQQDGGMAVEGAVLDAAREAGVPVPRVYDRSGTDERLGSPFLLVEHIAGETIPRKLLRDEEYAAARSLLAAQCGRALAQIHHIPADAVPELNKEDPLAQYRAVLDNHGEPHPAFELAFRWLEANRPALSGRAVVHGDFRNGNLIVGPEGLRAVIDWELAHCGDPMEDLGWLCVKAWRFGAPLPVGGYGTRDELYAAYEEESGAAVDREAVHWWEVFGTLRWGVICIMQADAHLSGAYRSVELAAIGRRVCENEYDLLELLP